MREAHTPAEITVPLVCSDCVSFAFKRRRRHSPVDDHKLTYFHAERYKQLSQFSDEVFPELIA